MHNFKVGLINQYSQFDSEQIKESESISFTLCAGRTSPFVDWNSIRDFPISPVYFQNKEGNTTYELIN